LCCICNISIFISSKRIFENRCLTSELILEVEMLAIFCCMVIHDKLILLNKSFFSGQNSDAASNKELVMISPW
jgi:hypothetical protein